MKVSSRVVDLSELESRLNGVLPADYRAYVQTKPAATLAKQGFDPKTLLILNLELHRLPRYEESNRRFFLNGDGCGNYYFVDLLGDPSKVLLWAHDPPGIEDPDCCLLDFLRDSEQTNRIDLPVERGCLWLCRTPTHAESILDPISLDEWIDAVRCTDGLEYQGYREGKNPFTGEVIRVETPGRTRVLGLEQSYIQFFHGRARLDDNPVSCSIAKILAEKLKANVLSLG